jgi:hypothetical protein
MCPLICTPAFLVCIQVVSGAADTSGSEQRGCKRPCEGKRIPYLIPSPELCPFYSSELPQLRLFSGAGMLPLLGTLPDMTCSTVRDLPVAPRLRLGEAGRVPWAEIGTG